MRGTTRHIVTACFTGAALVGAAGTAAAAALIVGASARRGSRSVVDAAVGGRLAWLVLAGCLAVALLLDAARVRPPAVHRQVPMTLSHRHGSRGASVRYGARLGVGPATILTTWLWWAWLVAAAAAGVGVAAVAGAVFALTRVATMLAVARGVTDGTAMARRVRAVIALDTPVRRGVRAAAAGLIAACAVGAVWVP